MSQTPAEYAPLTPDTLPARLAAVEAISARLRTASEQWTVREVGDGNLNLVFIVESGDGKGALVVKQALPYVRLVGDSWPLPLSRSFFEYHALVRQAARAPGLVPEVFHFDETQAIIAMEYLSPHHILRHSFIDGERHDGLGDTLGRYCADTLFRGSDLSMVTAERKADLALFADNVALCDITENLIFTDPYFAAEMNRHTSPQLDEAVARLRADIDLKVAVQHLKMAFCANAETLLHGDLHTGSIMVHGSDVKVIDPEFAFYGPMAFDTGLLIANMLMAWCSQPGHARGPGERDDYRDWILSETRAIWQSFHDRFATLWHTERTGILYPSALYEDQGHREAAEQALTDRLQRLWQETLGFAGVEMHRRILGLAHNIDFENIEDPDRRAPLEAAALRIGRQLIVNAAHIDGMDSVCRLVTGIAGEHHA